MTTQTTGEVTMSFTAKDVMQLIPKAEKPDLDSEPPVYRSLQFLVF